jgi:tRNA threonylcarbamoyladenosine biosynthesis protein TsaE
MMNGTCSFVTRSERETRELAGRLGRLLKRGDCLALEGDLGAGKTTFAQGIAAGLGVNEKVDSPTFTIIKEYEGRIPFYHMDVYRIDSPDEQLGLEEYFYGDGVCLVEWASRVEPLLPEETVWIHLAVLDGESREIRFVSGHPRAARLCEELAAQ